MRLKSFVIIEKDNHFLFVSESSTKRKGQWYFPGGHLNNDEDPVSAIIRETKEKAECEVFLDGIFYFKFQKRFLNNKLDIYYHGRTNKLVVKTDQDEYPFGWKWFSYKEALGLPLRNDALQILDVYRALKSTLPIYNFNYIRKKSVPIKFP